MIQELENADIPPINDALSRDPNLSSPLPPSHILEDTGKFANQLKHRSKIYRDPETGEQFVLLQYLKEPEPEHTIRDIYDREGGGDVDNRPFGQWMLSQMMKGVLPVADIVPIRIRDANGNEVVRLASRIMPMAQMTQQVSPVHLDVYRFVLRSVFNDYDHMFSPPYHVSNAAYDDARHTLTIYGFSRAAEDFLDMHREQLYVPDGLKQSDILRGVLLKLLKNFSGTSGLAFLNTIFNRVQSYNTGKEELFAPRGQDVSPEVIQNILVRRIRACLQDMKAMKA